MEVLRLLLRGGARLLERNNNGETVLDVARRAGASDVLAELEAAAALRAEGGGSREDQSDAFESSTDDSGLSEESQRVRARLAAERERRRAARVERRQAAAASDSATDSTQQSLSPCSVCLHEPRSVAFVPCGHVSCCGACAPRLKQCPLCREKIKDQLRVFL